MSFETLNLDEKLLQAIKTSGFTEATEIQKVAIPAILAGQDVMASAQTGTGKTAAFVLPALQLLLQNKGKPGIGPRILVLTPTRELAMQINDNIRQFGRNMKGSAGLVVGGMPYPPQMRMLKEPVDFLVATPGRLIDHMDSGRVNFSRVEMLILDEADRMLDMGFIDDIRLIIRQTPKERQTLLFSATFEGSVLDVAKQSLNNPTRIQLTANHQQHADIQQHMHIVDNASHKQKLIGHYLQSSDVKQAVIFTATKRGADELSRIFTSNGHQTAALHGDMGQSQRKRTIDRLKRGEVRLLVATDVAARGLDIRGISHVFNYDLPRVAEDYIHRIGRTGRGGSKGMAISLVSPDEWFNLKGIERLTGKTLNREVIVGLEPKASEPTPRSNKTKHFGGNKNRSRSGGNARFAGRGNNTNSNSSFKQGKPNQGSRSRNSGSHA